MSTSAAAYAVRRPRGRGPAPAAPGAQRRRPRRRRGARSNRAVASSTAERAIAASAREQPALGGALRLAGREGVRGHRLGLVAEQVGRTPVVGRGEGRRERGVHALLGQVVGELVARAAAVPAAATRGQLLAAAARRPARRCRRGRPAAAGRAAGAAPTRAPTTLARARRPAGRPGRAPPSASDSGTPASPAARARRHSTTLSGWPAVRAITSAPCAASPADRGQRLDRRRAAARRARTPVGPVGQPVAPSRVLGADRPDEQHARAPQPRRPGSRAGRRSPRRRPAGRRRPAAPGRRRESRAGRPTRRRRRRAGAGARAPPAARRSASTSAASSGSSSDPGVCVLAQQVREVDVADAEEHRAERVDEGLEEQRPLRRVAARPRSTSPPVDLGQVGRRPRAAGSCRCRPPRRRAAGRRRRARRRPRPGRARASSASRPTSAGPRAGRAAAPAPPRARSVLAQDREVQPLTWRRPGRCRARRAAGRRGRRTPPGRPPCEPAATWARIRSRTARSSNGSTRDGLRGHRTASRGSTTVSAAASRCRRRLRAARSASRRTARDPVGVRLVEQRRLGAEQVAGPGGPRRRPAPASPAASRSPASSSRSPASSRSTDQAPVPTSP